MVFPAVCVFSCLLWGRAESRTFEQETAFPKLVKYPDAMPLDEMGRADKLTVAQEHIRQGLDELVNQAGAMRGVFDSGMNKEAMEHVDNDFKRFAETEYPDDIDWIYEMSKIYLSEAPVLYFEAPSITPDEQLMVDGEIEDALIKSGLERSPKDVSGSNIDPFQMTSLSDVKTAIKSCKNELEVLDRKRAEISKSLRAVSINVTYDRKKMREYKMLKQELTDCANQIESETERLIKLEQVKKSLINQHGAGEDVEGEEASLENRETELVNGKSHDDQFNDL